MKIEGAEETDSTMNHVPYLDLKAQYTAIRDDVQAAFAEVCDSARFAQGPPTRAFEQEFATYCGVAHCVSVNSGTSALHLALRCLNIGPGDEVITTPFTFIATAWAISYVGATPVFVDIEPQRRALDPAQVEVAVTPHTKAIIPVHIFGMPADMDALNVIAKNHKLFIVEDAAQAHGARYKGKRVGQFGAISCFSFYPTKNLGAYGEGGALLTNDPELAARARALREHAQSARYVHEEIAYNYRMDSLQAAVLRVKLKRLDAWNATRAAHARRYGEQLAGTPYRLPSNPIDSESVWHCYVIECENRDRVRAALANAGIDTAINYPLPLHLQPVYRPLGYHRCQLPVAEHLCERCLSLPIYPELAEKQISMVASALRLAAAC